MPVVTSENALIFAVPDQIATTSAGQTTIDLEASMAITRSTVTWSMNGEYALRTFRDVYAAITETRLAGSVLTVILDRMSFDEPEFIVPAGRWIIGDTAVTSKSYGNPALNLLTISDGAVLVDPGIPFRSVAIRSASSQPVLEFTTDSEVSPPIIGLELGVVVQNNGTAPCYVCPPGKFVVLALLGGQVLTGDHNQPIVALGSGSQCLLRITAVADSIDPHIISGPADATLIVQHDGECSWPLSFPDFLGTIVNQPIGLVGGAGPTSFRPATPMPGCMYYDTDVGAQLIRNGAAWTTATPPGSTATLTYLSQTITQADLSAGPTCAVLLDAVPLPMIPVACYGRTTVNTTSGNANTTSLKFAVGYTDAVNYLTSDSDELVGSGIGLKETTAVCGGPKGLNSLNVAGTLVAYFTADGGAPDCADIDSLGLTIEILYYSVAQS